MRQASGRTRAPSPRQLPTDHDHDGELGSIREYQSDQPSMRPLRPPPALLQQHQDPNVTSTLDRSFHIRSATRDSCLGSEPDASVKGQYHARLPCRGWRSQRGMRGTRPARIARSADAAPAGKPPAFGGVDRPRTEASAGGGGPVFLARLCRPPHPAPPGAPAVPPPPPPPPRDDPPPGP